MTLLGPATYLAFVDTHGWSHEQYLTWMTEAAAALLLDRKRRTGR